MLVTRFRQDTELSTRMWRVISSNENAELQKLLDEVWACCEAPPCTLHRGPLASRAGCEIVVCEFVVQGKTPKRASVFHWPRTAGGVRCAGSEGQKRDHSSGHRVILSWTHTGWNRGLPN
jgi:hypothetical protein